MSCAHVGVGGLEMTEQPYGAPETEGCPSWCLISEIGGESHAHRSVVVESPGMGLTARLVHASVDPEPCILIDGNAITPREARAFAGDLLRLADQATLAPSGLDLVTTLARGRVTLDEMAEAAGIDVERLRAQRAGGRVLSVHELDRLALAVAHLMIGREDLAPASGGSRAVA